MKVENGKAEVKGQKAEDSSRHLVPAMLTGFKTLPYFYSLDFLVGQMPLNFQAGRYILNPCLN